MLMRLFMPLVLLPWLGQTGGPPPHLGEGDRIEEQFRAYRERLGLFFNSLRGLIQQQPPSMGIPPLEDAPPPPVSYGYGILPKIAEPTTAPLEPVTVFSYSWPITEGYIAGESIKLERAGEQLRDVPNLPEPDRAAAIGGLVREYRGLVVNQGTIGQYIQYNRFWQGSIASDRPRFDKLTKLYELMKSGDPDTALLIREVLGIPEVPAFVEAGKISDGRVVVRVPVYTDIDDQEFLASTKAAIENMWQAREADLSYALETEFRHVTAAELYPDAGLPERGARLDMRRHAARFPSDGAVLTTGAQTTHSLVGRYVALGPGTLTSRTLAHEFGHVLGFRDGYIRGYRDLVEKGFEILELTSVFDDIMSAPRQGDVQAIHFKLIIEAKKK